MSMIFKAEELIARHPEPNCQSLQHDSGVHGARALMTRATPRVAAKIEILSLHIE